MPPSATRLGTQRRRGSDLGGARSEARATGPRPWEQPQEVCGSIVFTLKLLPLIEQISFDLYLLSTWRGGWESLPYLRQITVTPSKHSVRHSTFSKRKINHCPKASLPSPQIIRNRNAFLSLPPGDGKDYPLQYSGLENSMDCIVHGVAKSWTRLSDFHFHFLNIMKVTQVHGGI